MIQAISPISMKLSQNEGYTKKTLRTKWFAFGVFLKQIKVLEGYSTAQSELDGDRSWTGFTTKEFD